MASFMNFLIHPLHLTSVCLGVSYTYTALKVFIVILVCWNKIVTAAQTH